MNKKLIAILTLVMFAMTLLPMGAFAATTNTPLQIKNIGDEEGQTIGNLYIVETAGTVGSISSGDEITITLLDSAKFEGTNKLLPISATNPANVSIKVEELNIISPVAIDDGTTGIIPVTNENTFSFKISRTSAVAAKITIDFSDVTVDASDVTTGQVSVDVYSGGGGVNNGQVTLAKISDGDTIATVLSTEKVTRGKSPQKLGTFRVTESRATALTNGKKIDITLPEDIDFVTSNGTYVHTPVNTINAVLTANGITFGGGWSATNIDKIVIDENNSGRNRMRIYVGTQSVGTPGFVTFSNLQADIDEDVDLGDIEVSIGGDATSEKLILGSVGDYGIIIEAPEKTATFYAGDDEQKIPTFYVKESAEGSIIGDGRTVKLTLPTDIAWLEAPATLAAEKGNLGSLTRSKYEDNRRTVVYKFGKAQLSTTKSEYKFDADDFKVAIKGDVGEKDVTITFSGTANIDGEIIVGKTAAPLTVKADVKDVVVGKKNQAIGDIIITEVKAGMLEKYAKPVVGDTTTKLEVVIDFDGLNVASKPTVEVTEGDLKIDKVDYKNDTVTFSIDSGSTKASTIKISNIALDVDRTPAEGDYTFGIRGSAVNRIGIAGVESANAGKDVEAAAEGLDAKVDDNVVEFVGATIVTPAPGEDGIVKPVVMTVGSTVYTIGGVEMTMDVAPYIKDSRTYFPVRYVAQALGITADNVVWDGAQRTVTIFRGNRIVQVTIGSTTMLVNGVPLTMDVAPEITADRTMLPIRFVAQGLGVNVDWDAATQTVTLR